MQNSLGVRANRPKAMSPRATIALLTAAMLAGAGSTRAASDTYTGTAGDNVFDTGTNWAGGTAPGDTTAGVTTNTDVATFGLASGTAITLAAQRNLLSILLTGGATAGFSIGTAAGPALLLSSGGTITSNGGSASVNAPLVIQNAAAGANGAYTFQTDTPGTSRVTVFGGTIAGAATSGTTTLTLTGGATTAGNSLNGVISNGAGGGALAIVKTGSGTWQLNNAANTFTGGVTVSAGFLRMNTSGNTTTALGTGAVTLNGGTLNLASTTATNFNNPLIVPAGTTGFLTLRGNDTFNPTSMTGTGTFTVNGTGSAGVVFTPTTFGGFGGTVDVESVSAALVTNMRLATAFDQTSLQNATVNLGANSTLSQQGAAGTGVNKAVLFGGLSGSGSLGGSGNSTGFFVYTVGSNNASTTYSGTITSGSSGTALTKVGTGTLTLTGANSYTGLTNINGGTLNINGINALGGANYAGLGISGGTLQYATGSGAALPNGSLDISNIGGTAKPVTIGAGGATFDTNGNAVTFANTIGNAGTGALTKTGTGVLTFAAAATYTGATNINAGGLALTTGGIASNAITLTGTGALTLGNATALSDQGILSLVSGTTLNLDGTVGTSETIFNLVLNGVTEAAGIYTAAQLAALPGANGITFESLNGESLTVAAVPEPSTWAMVLTGLFGLGALARFRRVRA